MAGVLKKTTGLTGLAVAAHPHRDLTVLYQRILRVLNDLPNDYVYRQTTEKIVKERAEIVKENNSVEAVEQKIGCGQVEELIHQARQELTLAESMLVWKPWEKLISEAPDHQWTWPPTK